MRTPVSWLFYGFLTLLLLVGDGKRSVVEVVGTAMVLILAVIVYLKKPIRAPGGGVIVWWALFLIYLFIRLPFSDSVAYSLYATVRYLIGFVIFVLFVNNLISARMFGRGTVGLALIALCLSVIVLIVPSVRTWMPEMSLLSNAYGHHHMSYLLIFAFPFAVRGFFTNKSFRSILIVFLFLLVLILTRARAAWCVAALYGFFLLVQNAALGKRWRLGLATVSVGLLVLFVSTSTVPKLFQYIKTGALAREKTDVASARFGYWQQAIDAFKDRPLLGTGLGTFYLSSLRYQAAPQSYSWLAHSYPLQILSEIGVIGIIGVIGVGWVVGKKTFHRYEDERQPIVEAVVLTGLYGVVDITLDYVVIWILVWAGLGLLYGREQTSNQKGWMMCGAIGLLAIFYVVSVGAEAGQLFVKNRVLLQPFNTQRTLAFLDKKPALSQKQQEIILWFHKKNSEVHAAAGYYYQALLLDSKNLLRFEEYFESIRNEKEPIDPEQLYTYLELTRPELVSPTIKAMASEPPLFLNGTLFGGGNKFMLAKMYYLLGMSLSETQSHYAKEALLLTTKLAQSWSYFYLELASYEFYKENDPAAAEEILNKCLGEMFAKDNCVDFSLETLPSPGAFKKEILSIP